MTKSELKKKRQQIVEQKGYKTYKQRKEEEKQQAKTIQTTSARPISTPSATNTLNWNNVVNRANQMLSNTRNVSNLINTENPLLIKSKANIMTEEQAKNIASIDDSKKRFEAISKLSNNRQQYQKNAMQVNTIRENEKSKKKAEKINADIAKGNYLSSVGHVLKGLPTEALNAVTKTTLSLANLNPNTKDSKEMMETGKLLTSRYNDTTSQINNKIVQGASRVSGTIGNMIPSIATGLMGGPAGLVNAINVGGSSYMENLNEEQDNKLKSLLTGTVKGTLSYNIEKLTGGNFLGKGSLDDLAKMGISKVKSDIGKRIASKLYEVGGEIGEENLENITGYVVDKLINDKDISMQQFISDLKQTTGDTAVTTLVLSALGLGGDTYNQVKINETIDNSTLSNEQKNALKKVAEENNVSLGEVEALISENNQNQATTMQNNAILQQEQQTIPNQDKTAQNQTSQEIINDTKNIDNQVKIDSENFAKQVDEVKKGTFPQRDMLTLLTKTPKPLLDIGLNDFPITMTQKHLDTIMNKEGKNAGSNYHDLGEDIIKQLPEAISNPLDIVESSTKSDSIVMTTYLADNQDRTVIASIKIDGRGRINDIEIDSNVMTSAYGRNNYESWMDKNIAEGRLLYDIDRGVIKKATRSRLQLPRTSNSVDTVDNVSTSNNIISQNDNNMQQISGKNDGLSAVNKKNAKDFEKYKRKILEGKQKEVNNLIQIKNQTLSNIENKIKEKQEILNKFKNKNSITAQKIKAQIETLKERYIRTENEYLQRIDRRNQRVNRAIIESETKKQLKRTRKEVQKALLEQAKIEEINLDDAKNISTLNMNRTDPIRLQEKVFGKKVGDKINEMFFNKVKHNTAEKTRFLNKERDSIKEWDIKPRSKESEVLQKYTEKIVVDESGKEREYTETDFIKDISDEKTRDKIIKASQELRKKYDNYIDTANDILVDLGYSPIPKRKDYVRHFTELNDIFTKYGIPGKLNDSLPTDINGLTEGFRPGKNFFANAQKRVGNKTTYDAITGIDGYLEGISNLIYHTEDIQRLRAFDKFIRDTYGENGLENFDKLSDKEKNKRIELIQNNHLSEYVKWLTEYTNNLAGKNSVLDRSVEGFLGRKVYSALNTIKKQTGSNMTGFNLGSALTNFISVAQGASKTKKIALLKGLKSSLANIAVKDDFVDRSDFLTNRFGSEAISKKVWDKASNAGQVFMSATDYLSSNIVVRSKYYEEIAKGKSEAEAMKIADDFGARILGDRSQGATAAYFNSKMLGIVTQFQLETNNQFETFIHDTKKEFSETAIKEGSLKASMGAVWTLGQLAVYQHIFNEVFEKINGNRPAFDIIEIIKVALGIENDDEDETVKGNLQDAVKMLIGQIPFINLFSENARLPVASALPNPVSLLMGESTLKKEASKLVYLLPPTGGGQAKKTFEGIKTIVDGGSYFINSKGEKELRFPVENPTAKDYIKAGLFGKYGLPLSRDYVESEYKRLNAKQTELYDNSTIEYKKLNEYLDYSKPKEIKKNDKISYINNMNITNEEKWDLYKYDIFSDTEREDGTSQVTDAEYAIKNKLATKSEYMKLYADAEKNEVEFPNEEKMQELKDNDFGLKTYMKYKTEAKIKGQEKKEKFENQQKSMLPISKEEQVNSKSLNDKDKINIIKQSKYSSEERDRIYVNEIGKEDDIYKSIKALNEGSNRIDDYLDYKTADLESDRKDDGTKNGKSQRNAEEKFEKYMRSSKFSNIERLYLRGTKYKLENWERTELQNYVKGLGLTKTEQEDIYKSLASSNVVEMNDGEIKWKK